MNTPLHPGEVLVKEGAANLQRGIETVGGRLYLTSQRLLFEAHRLNVQTGSTEVAVADVAGVDKGWTRFLGFLPLAPNAIVVRTRTGAALRFTLWGRAAWLAALASSGAGSGSELASKDEA